MNIFIFGAGYSAQAYAGRMAAREVVISGTSRDVEKLAGLKGRGIEPLHFDGDNFSPEIAEALGKASHLLISIAPPRDAAGEEVDPVLHVFGEIIRTAMPKLEWIGYLSTVGVYGNHDGDWVDETAVTAPVSARSIQRDIAEKKWLAIARELAVPLAILRLSGIYGPGRNAFRTIEAGRARRLVKPGQVFNRIHVSDIALSIDKASSGCIGGIFNITDNEPAPPQDVVTYAYEIMGREPPAELDFDTADITPMARSFYGDNKRVSNTRSKSRLGIKYQYPDYRTSLKKMWDEGDW